MADPPKPPPGFSTGTRDPKAVAAAERIKALARKPDERDLAPASRTVMEERVQLIMAMMRRGAWKVGHSDIELGLLWDIDPSQVRRYAAEASRTIRRIVTEHDEDKAAIVQDIRTFMADIAVEARQIGSPNGLRVAMDAMDRVADYLGVLPAKVIKTDSNPFKDWTDAELDEFSETGKRPNRKT